MPRTEENPKRPVFSTICTNIVDCWPLEYWTNTQTLVAVSGGPDSVLMLRALHFVLKSSGNSGSLVIGHVNHGTRAECESEQEFVSELAGQLGMEVEIENLSTSAETQSSEARLRQLRYDSLFKMAFARGARYLTTGHNQNDQIETTLFRILRGTGVDGLQGIPQFRAHQSVTVARPILNIERTQILEALQELGQDSMTDHSNQQSNYTRNFIRNELLPKIKTRFPDSDQAILRLSDHARQINDHLQQCVTSLDSAIHMCTSQKIVVDKKDIQTMHPAVVRQLLATSWRSSGWGEQSMTAEWWQRLTQAALSQESKQQILNLPGDIRATSTRTRLVLESPQ